MVIRVLKLGIVDRNDELFTLGKDSASFNAKFIKNNNLEDCINVRFLIDDEDPYFLGFEFLKENSSDSLRLMASSRDKKIPGKKSYTRRVKVAGLLNEHRIARLISKQEDVDSRSFEILKNANESFYKIYFRPIFENEIKFEDRNQIPAGIGIYRYFDQEDNLVYIGKGQIKDRANSPDRVDWKIKKIQYSYLSNEEDCFKWENFYLKKFEEEKGVLPSFNRISGKSS